MRWVRIVTACVLALSFVAVGLTVWAAVEQSQRGLPLLQPAVFAAIALLGAAQLAMLGAMRATVRRLQAQRLSWLAAIEGELEALSERMDDVEAAAGDADAEAARQLADQVKSLQLAVAALSDARRSTADPPRPAAEDLQPATRDPPPKAGDAAHSPDLRQPDRLGLYLEPIIRLNEQRTAHYRASLVRQLDDGTRMDARVYHAGDRRSGLMSDLDMMGFERAAPVLRHLLSRRRGLGVFCPVSSFSLSDDRFMKRLLRFVEDNGDVAGALVIEVSQRTLAELTTKGTEGLAYLAQLGATFSMSKTQTKAPDLATLAQLGFSFIDMDADVLSGLLASDSPDKAKRIRGAGDHGITVIAANVAAAGQLEAVSEVATLARGRYFSPPRMVRADLGRQHDAQRRVA